MDIIATTHADNVWIRGKSGNNFHNVDDMTTKGLRQPNQTWTATTTFKLRRGVTVADLEKNLAQAKAKNRRNIAKNKKARALRAANRKVCKRQDYICQLTTVPDDWLCTSEIPPLEGETPHVTNRYFVPSLFRPSKSGMETFQPSKEVDNARNKMARNTVRPHLWVMLGDKFHDLGKLEGDPAAMGMGDSNGRAIPESMDDRRPYVSGDDR